MENRITQPNIIELKENEIFVFGSNSEGNHAGGAAKIAKDKFGAIEGQSTGLQGQSYGINTMDDLDTIEIEVEDFILFAKRNSNKEFLVTEIGCGIAGFNPSEIAPFFFNAKEIKNIHLPESFWSVLSDFKPVIKAYKAFDKDFSCRGFKYEEGKEFEHKGEVNVCSTGFHACLNPLDVFNYYDITESRLAEVEMYDDIKYHNDDSKIASRKIKIKLEVKLNEFIKASVEFVFGKWFKKAISDSKKQIGYNSTNASSGNNSTNASSGNNSTNASSGENSKNASSGYNSKNASSGENSTNASSGNNSTNASSGENSKNASSGYNSKNASSGYNSTNASSGYNSTNASSGNNSTNASSGENSKNASSGYNSKNASSGYNSTIEMTGLNNVGAAVGNKSLIKGINGCFVCLMEYNQEGLPIGWVTGKIGENNLEENVWYKAQDGKFVKD